MNRKRFFTTLATGAAALSLVSLEKAIAGPQIKPAVMEVGSELITYMGVKYPFDNTKGILHWLSGKDSYIIEHGTGEKTFKEYDQYHLMLKKSPDEFEGYTFWLQWDQIGGLLKKHPAVERRLKNCQLNFIDKPEKSGIYNTFSLSWTVKGIDKRAFSHRHEDLASYIVVNPKYLAL